MIRKVLITISIFFLFGCNNMNGMSIEEIVDNQLEIDSSKANINRVGYKYYLPQEFNVGKDDEYVQELVSKNIIYYLNIDIISYHYKNKISSVHEVDDYLYYEFESDEMKGYLKITKDNNNFFVELCYNYAIIEVEVDESDLRYAISRAITILKSIKYNDLVIEKYITDNDVDISETIYKIPEPENKDSSKNILKYIESSEEYSNDE